MRRIENPFLPRSSGRVAACWLGGLGLLALALRLWQARVAPWYWDEGYVAAIAQDLGALRRPHAGALWANGLLPLTASWLAPLSAAPFTWLSPAQPIVGVRIWAAALGSLTCVGLGLLARRLGGWAWGLAAAGLLAVAPLAVALGGLGLYHALGGALGVAAFALAVSRDEGFAAGPTWLPWLLAGLAAASCYWLWWLPLGLVFRARERELAAWIRGLLLGFGPPALALGWSLLQPGGPAMFKGLLSFSDGLQPWPAYVASLRNFPFVWLGLPGLFVLGRRRLWIGLAVGIGFADLLRQRGSLEGSPYVLMPFLPWAALGWTVLAFRLAGARRGLALLTLAVAFGAASRVQLFWLRVLSVDAANCRNLRNYLATRHCETKTVLTVPPAATVLRAVCRPAELYQAVAWRGLKAAFLPAGLTREAFVFDPGLEGCAYLVVGRAHFHSLFLNDNVALEVLRAERAGWPAVFQNPDFRVYANPLLSGEKADPNTRILLDKTFYAKAAEDAEALGLSELAAFARRRQATARISDLPGRDTAPSSSTRP